MKKKLIVTTILGTGLLFNASAYGAFNFETGNLQQYYAYLGVHSIYGHGQFDDDIFHTLRYKDEVAKHGTEFIVNGRVYHNEASAITAYEAANPGKSFEIEDDGTLVYIEEVDVIIQNPNGTSIKFNSEGAFINGAKYTTEESFLNALSSTPGLTIDGNSTISVNGERVNLDQVLNNKEFAEFLGLDVQDIAEFKAELNAFNDAQAQLDAGILQLSNAKKSTENSNLLAQLEAQANRTAEQEQQITQLKAALAANGANLTPNAPETQETLKTQAALLGQISGSANPLIKANYAAKLEKLKALQDTLFVDASKTKTLSELTPVQKPDTITTDTLSASADAITGVVDNRLHGFTAAGVASGDFLQSFGGWVKGLYTKAEQKAHGLTTGYKLDQSGATIGFDAGDDIKIGAAYSFTKSRVTAKGISAKENITSHIGTIYGLATINDQFFASGQGSYGISNIKKSRNTADTNNNLASAKTKGNVAVGKLEFGYDYNLENSALHFVPSVGVAHNSVTVKGYKETGSGLNRKIGKRTTSRTSALLGVMTKYEVNMGSFALLPEIHANVDYALSSKNSDTKITVIDGLDPLVTPSTKLTKVKYTVGTSVKLIQSKAFNAGVGYDLGLAKKFMSHTGSINVRAEF